ncbi:MAG: hypothetical protein CVT70_07280 [Alphaproteobacteria bacterium HGW-Alphaproteobacteria-1]|nr:MAG: hypothetical protein CVT70_07280 [Alphaproteobacteria bacterium HGW-Alphaproteobacteria-1]
MPGLSALPHPLNAEGKLRRVGVEIELGGVSEAEVARLCADVLGGKTEQQDSHIWAVDGSDIGAIEVYLDIFLRNATKTRLRDLALDLGREVVPVEIVTEPLDMNGLARLDGLREALRKAGALGSGAGLLFGFGVHFNIEVASESDADTVRPLLAYALIEDWLRAAYPIDEARRLLPFTDPYPTDFVRALITAGPGATRDHVTGLYLTHTPSRNRGLDMLPLFAHFDPGRIAAAIEDKTSARPTFHFRLPDWRVAGDSALLRRLSDAWEDDHGLLTLLRQSWAARAGRILQTAGIDRE